MVQDRALPRRHAGAEWGSGAPARKGHGERQGDVASPAQLVHRRWVRHELGPPPPTLGVVVQHDAELVVEEPEVFLGKRQAPPLGDLEDVATLPRLLAPRVAVFEQVPEAVAEGGRLAQHMDAVPPLVSRRGCPDDAVVPPVPMDRGRGVEGADPKNTCLAAAPCVAGQ